jgi:IclR-like helix-turn-helix domain-containing protein
MDASMYVFAHLGNIPVEEWAPFVVPVVVVCLYVRRKERRRREAVQRLPDLGEPLDESTVRRVLGTWSAAEYKGLSREHLPLLYPPGPEGTTAAELAERTRSDPATVRRRLEELADLGYLELKGPESSEEPRAWLTVEGMDLLNATEDALLEAHTGKPDRPFGVL